MARTNKKVGYSPTGKLEDVTPDMAARGIEGAFRMLEGRWKMVIVFPPICARRLAVLRTGTGDSRGLAKDADPTTPRFGARRHRGSHRLSAGAAQGRICVDQMGSGDVPGAGPTPRVGSKTAEAFARPLIFWRKGQDGGADLQRRSDEIRERNWREGARSSARDLRQHAMTYPSIATTEGPKVVSPTTHFLAATRPTTQREFVGRCSPTATN
jgi:hypothetical protein